MTKWNGLYKLVEESGELCQVLGKLGAFPDGKHPDGKKDLVKRLHEEVGDVLAVIEYFIEQNDLDRKKIEDRVAKKLQKFNGWGLSGVNEND